MVEKTSTMDRTIIDAGGGIIVRAKNVDVLRTKGFIIWLKARPETIICRIKDNTNRPSLTGEKSFLEEVQEVLAERAPKYQAAAHVAIDTDNLSPRDVAEKIIEELKRKN
jgi:shikimate kinase